MPGDAAGLDADLRPSVGDPARNFEIPEDLESLAPATDKAKIQANIEAIRLLKRLESERRNATTEEKRVLASYTGWGAFKEAFNSQHEKAISEIWDKPGARREYMPDFLQSWERNHRANHKLLRENMTDEEFASASASTLNAHYTALPIIRSMWAMVRRMGFTGGRALEPSAGNGHYLGAMPAALSDRVKWQTVELDELSARLLSKLYPEATVNEEKGGDVTGAFQKPDGRYYDPASRQVTGLGFERARIPNGSLDLIISNVPFHESGPSKKGFPTLNLHNFFFAHALDKVKPGGLVAFITSESTMQNNIRQRDFIASKGDLVAAIRLPNNAFKANAGTEVTTDILIFRKPDGTPFKGEAWRNLIEVGRQTITLTQGKDQSADDFRREAARAGDVIGEEYWKGGKRALDVSAPIMVNEYFVNHPQHALGQHTLASSMYRAGGYALVAPDGMDVQKALEAVIPTLPENIMGRQEAADTKDIILADRADKPFSFKEQDGRIYEVQPDGSMDEAEWSTNPEMVATWRSWRKVADAIKALVDAETSGSRSEDELSRMRRTLNVVYDTHVMRHKPISRRHHNNHRHLESDPDYPLTAALENEAITLEKNGKKKFHYRKAEIFSKRIGRPIIEPTSATDVDNAVELSLAWRGRIDPEFAAGLLNLPLATFEAQALQRPDIYRNPATGMLETAEDYLTGNVRVKLMQAEAALVDDPRMEKNVAALKAAQPPRREIARIAAVLGARWIPAPVYNAFIAEVLQGKDTVEYIPAGNSWVITGPGVYATEEHGTERAGPYTLFKHALNMTEPLIYDGRGAEREFNPAETVAAKTALDKMRRAFIEFAKTSETPVTVTNESGESKTSPVWEAVEDAFNETQNSFVDPAHTGSYLTFPGLNTDYVYTRAHRRAVIARFLAVRRGMMAHGVGSGKTFNQIILAYEMRRLGLAKKPMIVVQNATLGQFATSFLKAYPGAKLLVPTKNDFTAENRRKLVAKIATGNWDAVLLPHSQFDKISNRPSAVKAYMDSQIDELMGIISKTKDKAKVRDLEGMIKSLQDRRQTMLDALAERQDKSIMWEELGIDALIMDEAHNYKSLPIVTRMGRVKGVPTSSDSQRAINFLLKVRDVQARTGGKNIFLATGTPIKNSMAEAYIMMQFMAPDVLEQFRIYNFDDFATTYGQTVTEAEMSWGGTPKMETRFAKFQNGPSLVTMIRTMFDVAFGNDKLGLDVPKIQGGEPEMVIVPATEAMQQFNAWTRSVNELWQNADSSEKEEFTAVPIQTMAAGVAAALDPRLVAPNLPDDPDSKVNTALRRVVDIYQAGNARRTTQIIFSDLRNKFSMDYLMPFTGHPFPDYGSDGEFDLYTDMRQKLIAAGIPEKEIHLMKSGLTDKQKEAIFEKVDNGEIRVIIGSTELLGVGVNIQSRLQAVHHLSPPRDFTPAMMEQRNGRIIRQGNLHASKVDGQPAWDEPVQILNYGTDGSMDSAIYGTLARKQRFITQLLMGDDMGDTFDDPTDPVAVNMAEMAARTLGDPDFIRRIELEREIKELRLQADAYTSELSGKRSRLSRTEAEARTSPGFIARLEAAAESFNKIWTRTAPRPEGVKEETDISDKPVYEFGGQVIDTAGKDGAITGKLDLYLREFAVALERRGKTYDFTTVKVNGNPIGLRVFINIPGSPTSGEILDGDDNPVAKFSGAGSLIQQLHRIPEDIRAHVSRSRERIADLQTSAERLRALLKEMPPQFPQADRLAALEREAREVDERIRAKAAPPEAAAKPAKDETADLPDMKLVSPGLMTYDVERVIDNADIEGNKLFLPDTLDRKLYQAVNAALEDAGGRWNRKAKAHIFKGDPRPYLGLAPMPAETPALAMSARRGYDGTHEQTGWGPDQLDRRTAASTQIQGSRVTPEQGQAIRDVHFARLLGGPLREGGRFAGTGFDWTPGAGLVRRLSEAFQAPVLTAEQERAIRALPSNDEGVESTVYLDRENGVIYKRLEDHQGKPSGGIWPHINVTSLNNLNWSFQPLTSPRRLGIRLALLSDIGGTPTEVAAIGRAGHIYLKQPLSPNPKIGRDEAFIDNSGLTIARRRAGIVEIPSRMLPQTAPRAFMAWSHNHAWLVFDLHPDNFIGDNQGQGRINDPVFGHLPPDVLTSVPGLSAIVEQAKTEATRLGDRANRLFMAKRSPAQEELANRALQSIFERDSGARKIGRRIPSAEVESTLTELRGSVGAGPGQSERENRSHEKRRQLRSLQAAATDAPLEGKFVADEGEHRVHKSGDVATKATNNERFGFVLDQDETAENRRLTPRPALPSEYLERLGLQNVLFGDQIHISGIAKGLLAPSIHSTQPWMQALPPSLPEIMAWMQGQGWHQLPREMRGSGVPNALTWYHPGHGVLAFDTKPSNFTTDGANIDPIDLSLIIYPAELLEETARLNGVDWQAWLEQRGYTSTGPGMAGNLAKASTTASPMARLGWNNLDRALSAKVAAHTRWARDTAAGTVAAWRGKPGEERIYGRIEKLLKKELMPDSVLPREVAAQKREMEIKSAIGSQKAMDLVRALSGNPKFSDLVYPPQFSQNPEWRRRLYMAMTGESPLSDLPAELQALAGRLRRILVDIGREAVKQGRMSLDTFENLQAGYMPHYYKEDVQREKSIFQRFRLGVRDILAQRTTAWHIADTSINGPDGQPRLVSWQGNQWRFRNQEHRDAFYEDFILQQALEEITNRNGRQNRNLTLADLRAPAKLPEETQGRLKEILRTLRARYKKERPLTAAEQERAGLIMDPVYAIARYAAQMVHDNSTAEFFNFVAENPAWTSKTASPGFTEIPDNPRFGRLAGRYVVDEIAGQVLELVEVPNQALQAYDTLLSWWKTGKTVLNPGTHVRNVLGNLFFSQIAGASVWNPGNLPFYRDAIRLLRNGGPELLEAYEQGVLGADFVSAELRQTLRQLLPDPQTIQDDGGANVLLGIGKAIGKVLPGWARNPAHTAYNKITSLYQAEDEVFKLAAYLKAKAMLEDGAPDSAERRAAAAAHVRKWFPYYDLSDSGTIKAAKRTFMPFMAFYRESIRIFGTALAERPLGLAAGLAFPSLMTYLSALVLGLDDDELEQVRRDMRGKAGKLLGPTPIEGAPIFSMLLPLRSDTGALQQWDIAAVHPFADFLGNRVEAAEGQDWYQQWWRSMLAAGPLGSLIYAQMTGRDAFGDRTFVEQNMSGGEKLAARADNAAKILLPPVLPGGTAFATLANAGTRTTNKTFELRSPTQAVLRAVAGVDVRNATPDLYRIADDWRQAQGLPTSEGMDYGSTPASRARKALFAVLAQDAPNLTAIKNITAKLKEMGQPVETPQDIQRLLFYRNPLMVIRGADNQQRFRASLSGLERQALDDAVREYERIKARAPALIRAARSR